MGPYLRDGASEWCARSEIGLYYGVDVELFRPADGDERRAPASRLDLPRGQIPRRSLEPDQPREGSGDRHSRRGARACARPRRRAAEPRRRISRVPRAACPPRHRGWRRRWMLGRPAVHPMKELADYFRAADVVALASLAEGAAYLDARSAGLRDARRRHRRRRNGGAASRATPSLTPRRDAKRWPTPSWLIAADPDAARAQRGSRDASTCAASGIARRRLAISRACSSPSRMTIAGPSSRPHEMTSEPDPATPGTTPRKQIHSRDPSHRWSHRRRFRARAGACGVLAGGAILDYGCGDGTFLGLLQAKAARACARRRRRDRSAHRCRLQPPVRRPSVSAFRRCRSLLDRGGEPDRTTPSSAWKSWSTSSIRCRCSASSSACCDQAARW